MGDSAAAKHQDVQPAGLALQLFSQRANVLILGEIQGTRVALRAKCLRFLGNSFERLFAPCSQVEFRAMPGKSQSDRSPDAAACSCDYSNMVLQALHISCRSLPQLWPQDWIFRSNSS